MKKTDFRKLLDNVGQKRDWAGKPLTGKQRAILEFIKAHVSRFGYPPTRAEIADAFGVYVNGIQQHLLLMQRKGAVRLSKCARGIEITSHD